MTLAGTDEDRLAGTRRQRSVVELDGQLASEHEEELVAVLAVPAAIESSIPGMQHGLAVHDGELRVDPVGRRPERRWIGLQRLLKTDLSAQPTEC